MTREETGSASRREETEVKLPCADLGRARESLRDAGALLASPLHFESNDLFDDAERRLADSGSSLRLRRTEGGALLTFKGPARFDQGIKVRQERETAVADAAEIEAILAGLGFQRGFRYEKRREEWTLEGCAVALDETPIGSFLEVEGPPTLIRRVLLRLGLDFASAIPYTYVRLYKEARKKDPKLPEDMVFTGR